MLLPTELNKRLQRSALNVLLDEEDKVKVAGGFPSSSSWACEPRKEEIARFENAFKKCQLSLISKATTFISASSRLSTGTKPKRLSEEEIRFQCDCSHERLMNALASLPSSGLTGNERGRPRAEIPLQHLPTTLQLDEKEEIIRDKSY